MNQAALTSEDVEYPDGVIDERSLANKTGNLGVPSVWRTGKG